MFFIRSDRTVKRLASKLLKTVSFHWMDLLTQEIVVVTVLKMGHDWSLLPMRSDPSVICENDDQNLSLDMQ